MGRTERRVYLRGLFKAMNRLVKAFFSLAIPVVLSLEINVVCFQSSRRSRIRMRCAMGREFHSKFFDDAQCDLILHFENVS